MGKFRDSLAGLAGLNLLSNERKNEPVHTRDPRVGL